MGRPVLSIIPLHLVILVINSNIMSIEATEILLPPHTRMQMFLDDNPYPPPPKNTGGIVAWNQSKRFFHLDLYDKLMNVESNIFDHKSGINAIQAASVYGEPQALEYLLSQYKETYGVSYFNSGRDLIHSSQICLGMQNISSGIVYFPFRNPTKGLSFGSIDMTISNECYDILFAEGFRIQGEQSQFHVLRNEAIAKSPMATTVKNLLIGDINRIWQKHRDVL